jgi:hypothetical protein
MHDVPARVIFATMCQNFSVVVIRYAERLRTALIAKSIAVRHRFVVTVHAIQVKTRVVWTIVACLPLRLIALMGSIMIATV